MKSHSGLFVTLDRGAIFTRSTTQNLNTTSSTESEVVASAEVLTQALWTASFLEHQGYSSRTSLLHQDNQAAMLLLKSSMLSRRKRLRHIDIRFFFIKDRIDSGEVEVVYCNTDDMTVDYLTKPLQGSKFRIHRARILGLH